MRANTITEALKKSYLLAGMPEDELHSISTKFTLQVFQLGEVVIREGDAGDSFYVIHSGKARVVDDSVADHSVTVAVLGPGDSFGERALLYHSTRTHTVRAAGVLTAMKLSARDFDDLVANHPGLVEQFETRIRRNTEFNFLRSLGLLTHLTLAQIEDLLTRLETVQLQPGEYLFRQNEPGQSCFIVRKGKLRVMKETNGTEIQVGVVKPGALIGEMSLIFSQPRSASIVASEPAVLLGLNRELFEHFLDNETAQQMVAQLAGNRLMQVETMVTVEPGVKEPEGLARPVVRWARPQGRTHSRMLPFVTVAEPALTGVACAMMLSAFHSVPNSNSNPPRADNGQDQDANWQGTTADTLLTLSWKIEDRGYIPRLLQIEKSQLPARQFPAVVELGLGEFAVVYEATKKTVLLANPLDSEMKSVPAATFEQKWNGQILTVANIPNFALSQPRGSARLHQVRTLLRPHVSLLIAILVVSLIIQMLGLAQPLFSKIIVDKVLVYGDRSLLYLMLAGMLLVTAFQLAANSLRDYLVAHIMRRISGEMQLRFFHHILSLSQRVFQKWQVGDLLLRFQENEKLLQLVSQSGFKVVIESVMAITYVAILFTTNAPLATATVPFIFGVALTLLVSSPMLRSAERRVFAMRQLSESHLIEAAAGIQTVKSLAIETPLFERGSGLITNLKMGEFSLARLSFNSSLIAKLLNDAASITILGYGANLAMTGKITTGELIAFQGLFGSAMAPLTSLVKLWDELQEIRISFERTSEVLRSETESQPKDAVTLTIAGRVELQKVSFRYSDDQENVLSDIQLEILAGQKIALVGRSGSGKTTLANLLLNLYNPTDGKILIDNVDIKNIHKSTLRRQVGVVEQNPFLFSGTVRENIGKSEPGASLERIVAAAVLAGAHEFIEELPLGYDTQVGERGMTLSGGQKQRLVIARALLGNPKMLLLDEATSALDSESETVIQRNLDSLMNGRTVFVIAHRLSTVRNADLIVVLDKGQIVEKGTHAELIARRGLYSYLNQAAA